MLLRSIFAKRAPVAVVYDGGGVYFGGASSTTVLGGSIDIVAGILKLGRSIPSDAE